MRQENDEGTLFWNHVRVVGQRLESHFRPEKAMEWFNLPHPELGNQEPATLVAEGRIEDVLALIDRMDQINVRDQSA